jgi:hypothetical protein
MKYPKGSEWRKWDLQVQTILDDGYTSLKDYYEEIKKAEPARWQEFVAKVGGEANALLYDSKTHFTDAGKEKKTRCIDYARTLFAFVEIFNPELECIGITDHNYFDDFLLDALIDYSKGVRCKAIPGVEINCNGVHMLLLFREKLYGKDTFSAGIHAFLTRLKIDAPRKNGVLVPTTSDIKEVIAEVRQNDGIVIYPHCNSDKGLFRQEDKTILAETFNFQKLNLLQFQNREGFAAIEEYIGKKNKNLTSKYCLHVSSDARALKDIGRPDKDGNFLWIKANPTFDGLKQIVFEPEQRVLVGPQKPEGKKPYFLIDKVRFLDNTPDVKFGSDPIEINQNLTTIVGGKSTGKSLLLYYMAKTINRAEVENRLAPTGLEIEYGLEDSPEFNFEVIWKDGQSTLLKPLPTAGPVETKERKILYVPQKYLNTLSEKNIGGREALNEFIVNVILQDPVMRAKHEEAFGDIALISQSLPTKIAELFAEGEEIKKTEEELKQAGDEKGIVSYIQSLQIEIEKIKSDSGLTETELADYEVLTNRQKEISTRIANLEGDKKTLKTLQAQLLSKLGDVRDLADEHEGYINDEEIKQRLQDQLKIIETFGPSVTAATSNVLLTVDQTTEKLNSELTEIKVKLAPYLAKVQAQSMLQDKSQAIQKEQKKLADIGVKKNAVKTKEASYSKRIDGLADAYTQVAAKYETLRNEFKTFESKFGDISLAVQVAFKEETFNAAVVEEYLNKRDAKKCVAEGDWTEESKYRYDPQNHLANLTAIMKALIKGSAKTVKSRSAKDAVSKLLENFFFLDFKIFYKNDALEKMSPGKKGLVLLRLLINLSNEEWPILLDQPEDDLDNRSVYEDLVRFIKDRKSRRQIIIVTHNPNLVIGADAEEVVVANQSGQEVGRENKKFRFEYISDAIEDSFNLDERQEPAVLFRKGIREHVCEILEGGPEAFQKREQKYNFPK